MLGRLMQVYYDQLNGLDPMFSTGCLSTRESYDSMNFNFLHQRILSRIEGTVNTPEMDSNAIFFGRYIKGSAVFAIDYVNQDDLYPHDPVKYIRKDESYG